MNRNDRVQSYLDGELPLEALSADERLEAERYAAALDVAAAAAGAGTPGDLTDAVMRRVAALDPVPAQAASRQRGTGLAAWAGWLWRPRAITLRPALAAAGLALWAASAAMLAVGGRVDGEDAQRVFVQFRLDAANVEHVALAGDFTAWRPLYELHESGPGVWSVTIALEPGVHDYAFVIDGERWVPDPLAPAVDDGFGGVNSRVAVLVPERRRAS